MAEPGFIDPRDWSLEVIRGIVRLYSDEETSEEVHKVMQALNGATNGTFWGNREVARDEILEKLQEVIKDAGDKTGNALGTVIKSIYGVDAIGDSIGTIASGGGTQAARFGAGDSIVKEIMAIFDIDAVAAGYKARLPGSAEHNNFARFVGMNWQLQMADLIAEMASKWVPWDIMGGVREIGDKVQKVLGLEDAQEEIMEPLMEKLIIAGLEQKFNRETKPVDITPSDAIAMHVRGLLTRDEMNWTLDNAGVMDDRRDKLIELNAKNLTESDAKDLFYRGAWQQGDLDAYLVSQGYLAADVTRKSAIIRSDRIWKLQEELLNVAEQQVVKGVIQEGEYEGLLRASEYSAEEIQTAMAIAQRKKTLSTATALKPPTGTFNITPERVKEGATALFKWNIKNADSVNIEGLGTVGPRGEEPVAITASRTYTLRASNDSGGDLVIPQYVEVRGQPELRLPRVSLSLSPRNGPIGSLRELRWDVSNAQSVIVDGAFEAPQGVRFVTPVLPTFYTLTASNEAGSISTQDVALVELPDDLIDPTEKPSVQFSISPLVVQTSQPQVEIKWGTQNSESQTLTFPDGRTISVDSHGARLETITASGVFTFRARNDRGETHRQEAVIFKAPAVES